MKKKEMEKKVNTAFENATPDNFGSISAELGSPAANEPISLDEVRRKKKGHPVRSLIAVAAALAIIIGVGSFGYGQMKPAAFVSIDVNPSVNLTLNSKERVLKCEALNDDGKDIIDGMDMKGANVDVAVNELIGSMVTKGYISDTKNSVLVSVSDSENAKALEEKLSREISEQLNQSIGSAAVLSQTVTNDSALKATADEHHISEGKARLINSIIKSDPTLKFGDLAKLSVNELNLLAQTRKDEKSEIKAVGTASSKSYIGAEAAVKAAQAKFAGSKLISVEMDCDNGKMVYEVELNYNSYEYDVEIDALTGSYLRHERGDALNPDGSEKDDDPDDKIEDYFDKKEEEIESRLGIKDDDYDDDDDYTGTTVPRSKVIGMARAKAAALAHFGFADKDVIGLKADEDFDEKAPKYDVEFRVGIRSYEAEVDAVTGAILHSESELGD